MEPRSRTFILALLPGICLEVHRGLGPIWPISWASSIGFGLLFYLLLGVAGDLPATSSSGQVAVVQISASYLDVVSIALDAERDMVKGLPHVA